MRDQLYRLLPSVSRKQISDPPLSRSVAIAFRPAALLPATVTVVLAAIIIAAIPDDQLSLSSVPFG
jgi:hypothetical protein